MSRNVPMIGFHELYENYSRDVHRFALYLSGDPALADDITSETFVRVWSSPEPVRLATVKGYLLTIARNLWLMERRRRLRREGFDEVNEDLLDTSPGVLQKVEGKAELSRVLRALQEFAHVDRTALLMRAVEGLPYEEIAVALGLPVATVKVKVHRARLRLAQISNQGVSAK